MSGNACEGIKHHANLCTQGEAKVLTHLAIKVTQLGLKLYPVAVYILDLGAMQHRHGAKIAQRYGAGLFWLEVPAPPQAVLRSWPVGRRQGPLEVRIS